MLALTDPRPRRGLPSLGTRLGLFVGLVFAAGAGLVAWLSPEMRARDFTLVAGLVACAALAAKWLAELVIRTQRITGDANLVAAWEGGLRWLESRGINLAETPVVVVLGPADDDEVRDLLAAGGYRFKSFRPTDGLLTWHLTQPRRVAGGNLLFLSLTETSSVSQIAAQVRDSRRGYDETSLKRWVPPIPDSSDRIPNSSVETADLELADPASSDFSSELNALLERSGEDSEAGSGDSGFPMPPRWNAADAAGPASQMRELGRLLRESRHPGLAANGLLLTMPIRGLSGPTQVNAGPLPHALRFDMEALSDGLETCLPVTTLILGMEDYPGFDVLVERMECAGEQRNKPTVSMSTELDQLLKAGEVRKYRFGKAADSRWLATRELIEAVVEQACRRFEERSLSLTLDGEWRRKSVPNRRLVILSCLMRSRIRPQLTEVLQAGLCSSSPGEGGSDRARLGGVYFGSVGPIPAFIRSVMMRVEEQLELSGWSQQAIKSEARTQRQVGWLVSLNLVLALLLGGAVIWRLVRERWFAPPRAAVEIGELGSPLLVSRGHSPVADGDEAPSVLAASRSRTNRVFP